MKTLPLLCFLYPWFGPVSAEENRPSVVTVSEGADALLPCSLGAKQKVEKFDWRKKDEEPKKDVFLYDRGSHYLHDLKGQDPGLVGRVSFFEDELENGNASIRIKNTRLEDNGTYSCVIFEPYGKEIQIWLNVDGALKKRNVTGAAPEPNIKPIREKNYWSFLECKVQGVPKPEVEWRNSAGEVLTKPTDVTESEDRRFLNLYVNVTKSDNYTCVATQKSIFHQINNTLEVTLQDVVAVVAGDDAVLPCSLDSKENIKNTVFEWRNDKEKVYFYNRGQVERDQFERRVSHFEDELKFGNASIKILNTQLSDNGRYTCTFPDKQDSHVILIVLGKNSSPGYFIPLVATVAGLAFVLLVAVIIFIIYCLKSKPRQQSPEDQSLNPKDQPK